MNSLEKTLRVGAVCAAGAALFLGGMALEANGAANTAQAANQPELSATYTAESHDLGVFAFIALAGEITMAMAMASTPKQS